MKRESRFAQMNYGILCSSDMKHLKYRILYACLVLFMVICGLCVLLPVLWMMLSGFKEPAELISKHTSFFPKQIKLSKLGLVWNQMKFYQCYLNTIIMSLGAVVADVVVNGLAGYVLSRLKPKGSKFYFALITTLMMIPGTVSMVPNYMTFQSFPYLHFSLINTFWPIWMMAAVNMFNILLFKTSFDAISNSLIEAAKIDGASSLDIFFRIVIPLSVPVITTVSLFTFNGQFGNFFWPYLLVNDKAKEVVGIKLFNMKSGNFTQDYQLLAVFFSILPQMLIFALFQKQIVGGINIGGVKG